MSKAVNGIVIGVAIFILLAGSIWYVAVANGKDKVSVNVETSFEHADAETTRVRANLTLINGYDVEVRLRSIDYEFKVGDLTLAAGPVGNESGNLTRLAAHERHSDAFIVTFPTNFVSAWLKQHVADGERSTVTFQGKARLLVGNKNQTVDFRDEHTFSTKIEKDLEGLHNCPQTAPEPCVDALHVDWKEHEDSRVLQVDVDLKNTASDDVKVDHPTTELRWSNVSVGKAEAGGVILPAGKTSTVEFLVFLEHEKLKDWWADHASHCESSPMTLGITLTYQDQPTNRTTTTPSPTSVSPTPTFTPSTADTNTTSPTPTSSTPTAQTSPTSSPPPPPPPSSSPPATSTTTVTASTVTASPVTATQAATSSGPSTSTVTVTASPVTASTVTATQALQDDPIHSTTFLFVLGAGDKDNQTQEPKNETADWTLGTPTLHTGIVCSEPSDGGGFGIPGLK